ncbi:unnamed protein product [Allacma fusca]|uniref:Uncharacterized protein n=1 Tax=Allacma fusca TaxID=39272 RepID=A0A8J2LBA3_9HEXA|nr:unnamed protein product [Allacma fusca]
MREKRKSTTVMNAFPMNLSVIVSSQKLEDSLRSGESWDGNKSGKKLMKDKETSLKVYTLQLFSPFKLESLTESTKESERERKERLVGLQKEDNKFFVI